MYVGVKFFCELCEFTSTDLCKLNKHIVDKHTEPKHVDDENAKSENIGNEVDIDVSNHLMNPEFLPERQFFVSKDGMKVECTEVYTCDQCNYVGSRIGLIKHHKVRHTIYPCDLCQFTATKPCRLKLHIEAIHLGLTNSCEQCDYQTPYPHTLKRHIESRHFGTRFLCEFCEYSGKEAHLLAKHTHTDITDANPSEFSDVDVSQYLIKQEPDAVRRFFVVREGKKEVCTEVYSCDQCKFVGSRIGFIKHQKSNHLTFSCDQCSYTAKKACFVRYHTERVHLGLKHLCDLCGFEANTRKSLKKHEATNH